MASAASSRHHCCAAAAACAVQLLLLLLLLLHNSCSTFNQHELSSGCNTEDMRAKTLFLPLLLAWLGLAVGTASKPHGTAKTADSVFQPCDFSAFDSALRRFSKALTFQTISNGHTESHALHEQEFRSLW
jgi:hypothetical protein